MPNLFESLDEALKTYDAKKGWWRRLFGDAPAIKALRTLKEEEKADESKVLSCFFSAMPQPTQASYDVYKVIEEKFTKNRMSAFQDLYKENFLTEATFNVINNLAYVHIKRTESLFTGKLRQFKAALKEYDKTKSWWRRLFGVDAPEIKALRALSVKDRCDLLKISTTIFSYAPAPFSAAYQALIKFPPFERNPHSEENLYLFEGLGLLYKAGILIQPNFDVIINTNLHYRREFVIACSFLQEQPVPILTQTNFDFLARLAIKSHVDPSSVAQAIGYLHRSGILTPENLQALQADIRPSQVAQVIYIIRLERNLTQEFFDILMHPNNAYLRTENCIQTVWARLPDHLLRDTTYTALAYHAQQANPEQAIRQYVDQLLNIPPRNRAAPRGVNNAQSTHTASTHATVSAAATKLMQRYGRQINTSDKLDGVIAALGEWADNLLPEPGAEAKLSEEELLEKQSAVNAVRFLQDPRYAFTDPKSGVSTRQLLALVWLGLHDGASGDVKQKYTFKDLEPKFITALYDIQRGYNLDENFVDDKFPQDIRICSSGTFNKIAEILWGAHPDVELIFLSQDWANERLQELYPEEMRRYINDKYNQIDNVEAQEAFFTLLDEMQNSEQNPNHVWWMEIKNNILLKMMADFGPSEHFKELGVEPLYLTKEDQKLNASIDALRSLFDSDEYQFEREFSPTPNNIPAAESSGGSSCSSPSMSSVASNGQGLRFFSVANDVATENTNALGKAHSMAT